MSESGQTHKKGGMISETLLLAFSEHEAIKSQGKDTVLTPRALCLFLPVLEVLHIISFEIQCFTAEARMACFHYTVYEEINQTRSRPGHETHGGPLWVKKIENKR